VLSTSRERDALNRVNELRQEEQQRIESKEKKHQTFLRKQIIDDLHDDLIQNVVEPLKIWTDALVSQNDFCTKSHIEVDDDEFDEVWDDAPKKSKSNRSRRRSSAHTTHHR